MTPTITNSQIQTALRAFLLSVLPSGAQVFAAQVNMVPEPINTDFVTMTPLRRERLATNEASYGTGTTSVMERTRATFQLDVHGPNSTDNVQLITTLFRDNYAVQSFGSVGIAPLHADDARQMPFINAEQQFEDRWVLEVVLQANPAIVLPQDFADSITATLTAIP